MILKDGKFYENGIEIPLEAGNKEQIALMKVHNGNIEKLKSIERLKSAIKNAFLNFNSLQGQVLFINELREAIHSISPFKNEPVDFVKWVKSDQVVANDYNPNSVAPPEMQLLEVSIVNDGYTQPIVTWPQGDKIEVIDGFHRNRVGKESKEVAQRIQGYLPTVIIKKEREGKNDRIASTIRHNRARGKHAVSAMSDIVIELKKRNWSESRIGKELGMDEDEILRLCQISGLAEAFENDDFSKAWESAMHSDQDIPDLDFEQSDDE
jgi:ParB-like chromosome segregation protein Spo0J